MVSDEKRKVTCPPAMQKGIYEYENSSGNYHGLCLVVSCDRRKFDKYISIISLTDGDMKYYDDAVEITTLDGKKYTARCGMLTYIRRDRLGKLLETISDCTMNDINKTIQRELGILSDTDYEKMYHNLINTIAGWNKEH